MKTIVFYFCLMSLLLGNVPSSYSQSPDGSGASLRIVSWNIQMLPQGFFSWFSAALRKKQQVRLPWIVEHCNQAPYDVIVFQEVFHPRMYKALREGLQGAYPYQVETKRRGGKISNGIFIVSRLPLRYLSHSIYDAARGIDKMASKGCTLVEVQLPGGQTLHVAGTHLQAGGGEKEQIVRQSQYVQMAALLQTHGRVGVPQLAVGDMNTEKSMPERYQAMLQTLNMLDFPLDDPSPYTVDALNTWTPKQIADQIDYVLLQPNQTSWSIVRQSILRPQGNYKGKVMNFTDHYGIETLLQCP